MLSKQGRAKDNRDKRRKRGGFFSKLRSGKISTKPSRRRGRRLAGKAKTRGRWGSSFSSKKRGGRIKEYNKNKTNNQ